MDEQVSRSLTYVKDFKALARLEKNVRIRMPFDNEIAAAFKTRAETIARDIIEQRTGDST